MVHMAIAYYIVQTLCTNLVIQIVKQSQYNRNAIEVNTTLQIKLSTKSKQSNVIGVFFDARQYNAVQLSSRMYRMCFRKAVVCRRLDGQNIL